MLTVITLSVAVLSFAPSVGAVTYELEIEDFANTPGGLHINPGDAIEWRNRVAIMHSSTSYEGILDS